jgi:hypothetical protein
MEDEAISELLGPAERPHAIPSQPRAARILGALGDANAPVPVGELGRLTKLDFLTLSGLLLDMQEKGEVAIAGPPGEEVISLGDLTGD